MGVDASLEAPPSAMLVAISHWRSDAQPQGAPGSSPAPRHHERLELLGECVKSVLELDVSRVLVAVITNQPHPTAAELGALLESSSGGTPVSVLPDVASFGERQAGARGVVVIGWRGRLGRRHGYYLTWAHKSLFRRALRDPDLSHFLYLEDDERFTDESLSYWCRYRAPLARHGVLPGFVRYETNEGVRYLVDHGRPQKAERSADECVVLSEPDGAGESAAQLRFLALRSPYQGLYVLDRRLAIEHLSSSPARSPLLSRAVKWPTLVRERASIGPILDNVPPGFTSRNVVPVRSSPAGEHHLDPACLIEHLAGNYSRSESWFGQVPVEDMFRRTNGQVPDSGSSPRRYRRFVEPTAPSGDGDP